MAALALHRKQGQQLRSLKARQAGSLTTTRPYRACYGRVEGLLGFEKVAALVSRVMVRVQVQSLSSLAAKLLDIDRADPFASLRVMSQHLQRISRLEDLLPPGASASEARHVYRPGAWLTPLWRTGSAISGKRL